MGKEFKVCIFDLDGTLLHTLPTVLRCCNDTLVHFGLSPITEAACRQLCRHSIATFYLELARLGGAGNPEELAPQLRDFDIALYLKDATAGTEPFPGIRETLLSLRQKGVKTAVLSNKPHEIVQYLSNHFFDGLFDESVGQKAGMLPKPDPAELVRLAGGLGASPEQCVYVGDTDVDAKTAKNAGVFLAAVSWGYQDESELAVYQPDLLIRHPSELTTLF